MYRFSVDRLFKFKRDPALMCLLEYYISNNLIKRMNDNQAMSKHREAYFEAVEKLFEASHVVQGNKIILVQNPQSGKASIKPSDSYSQFN